MTARNRSQVFSRSSGLRGFSNSSSPAGLQELVPTETADCSDQVVVGDCAPFYVNKRSTHGGVMYKKSEGYYDSWFDYYVVDWLRNLGNGGHLAISDSPSDVEAATAAAARTNPSRPYVDVPVAILDTRRGLQSLYQAGESVFQRFARRHLTDQFTIRPLVRDIVRLTNLHEQLNRRIHEINRLYKGHGIRKTVLIGRYEKFEEITQAVQSAGAYVTQKFQVRTFEELKVHVRWGPSTMFAVAPSPDQIRRQALRAVQGLTVDFSTMWELMPWSWLIDWFSNISEFLIAQRNIVPADLYGVHPMRHTKTYWEAPGFNDNPNWTLSPIRCVTETKVRHTSFVAPYADLNFLNGSQLNILAALSVPGRHSVGRT